MKDTALSIFGPFIVGFCLFGLGVIHGTSLSQDPKKPKAPQTTTQPAKNAVHDEAWYRHVAREEARKVFKETLGPVVFPPLPRVHK